MSSFNTEVFGKRNFAALDDIYTRGARILPPGAAMISGREAIKKFWTDLVQSANAKSATLSSVDVMQAGDGVVEIGKATFTVEPSGESCRPDGSEVRRLLAAGGRPLEVARGHLESELLIRFICRFLSKTVRRSRTTCGVAAFETVVGASVKLRHVDVLVLMRGDGGADLRRGLAGFRHAVGVHAFLRAGAALAAVGAGKAAQQAGVAQCAVAAAVAG